MSALGVLAGVLATVVVLLLVFVQPRRGRARFLKLQQDVLTDPTARVAFYKRGIAAAWILSAIVLLIGLLAHAAGHDVGLPPASARSRSGAWGMTLTRSGAWGMTLEMLIVIPLSALLFRSRKAGIQRLLARQIGHLRAILPVSANERRVFVGVALTAGICEEIVFRWFGITYVRWVAPGSSNLTVIVLIGVVFGLAHYYQGRNGVLITGAAGGLFTWLTLASGSLIPAIVIHALIDLRIVALRELPEPDPSPLPV